MLSYPGILYSILVVLVGRSHEVVVGYLSLEREVLGGVSLKLVPQVNCVAYFEYISTFVAKGLGLDASLCSCTLDLSMSAHPVCIRKGDYLQPMLVCSSAHDGLLPSEYIPSLYNIREDHSI